MKHQHNLDSMITVNECCSLTAYKEVWLCLLELHVITQQQRHSKLVFELQNRKEDGVDLAIHLPSLVFKHHLPISVVIQGKTDAVVAPLANFNGLLQCDYHICYILHIQGANVHNTANATTKTMRQK